MAFEKQIQEKLEEYVYGHLPNDEWYDKNFYPFIKDTELRNRLIIEFKNARILYKIFEGLQAKENLLLAQVKTQVIMYVSIQEAVINYVLFDVYKDSELVKDLMYQQRLTKIDIPQDSKSKLQKELHHMGKEILTYYLEEKAVDITKIRYDQKVETIYNLNLISENLKEDLINLYTYRNTVHLEAEIKKGLKYDLQMSELAYRRVEGLSMELSKSIQRKETVEE